MYKTHAKIKRCLSCCPLYGGCPHLGGSVKGGSTVFPCLSSGTQGIEFHHLIDVTIGVHKV